MEETSAGFEKLPEGEYLFQLVDTEKFALPSGKPGHRYKCNFIAYERKDMKKKLNPIKYVQSFFSWDINELVKPMLGREEDDDGKLRWERDELKGKEVEATIKHELNKKDNKLYPRMRNITEHLPF